MGTIFRGWDVLLKLDVLNEIAVFVPSVKVFDAVSLWVEGPQIFIGLLLLK